MEREKEKLERKRLKLLQAHYADAIPLDLLKAEQDKISKDLIEIDNRINAHTEENETVINNLNQILDVLEDCGLTYRNAPDTVKRAFNQVVFEKLLIYSNEHIEPKYSEPFEIILDLINSGIVYEGLAETTGTNTEDSQFNQNKNPILTKFFGQGLSNRLLATLL